MENEYNDNVLEIANRLHEAYGTGGEKNTNVELDVASKLDELGLTADSISITGTIGEPKVSYEKEGKKEELTYLNMSNDEYRIHAGLEGEDEPVYRINSQSKTK